MNKLFTFLSLFFTVLVSAKEHKEVNFLAVVLGVKGFLHGFQKGVYDDKYFRLDEDCLTTYDSGQKMVFVYEFINGRQSPYKVLQFVQDIKYLIQFESKQCGYTDTIEKM